MNLCLYLLRIALYVCGAVIANNKLYRQLNGEAGALRPIIWMVNKANAFGQERKKDSGHWSGFVLFAIMGSQAAW